MKRDTKIGLIVAVGFLGLVGYIGYKKLHQQDDLVASLTPTTPENGIAPLNTGKKETAGQMGSLPTVPNSAPPTVPPTGGGGWSPMGAPEPLPSPGSNQLPPVTASPSTAPGTTSPPMNPPSLQDMKKENATEVTQTSANTPPTPSSAPPSLPSMNANTSLPAPSMAAPPSSAPSLNTSTLPPTNLDESKSKEPTKETPKGTADKNEPPSSGGSGSMPPPPLEKNDKKDNVPNTPSKDPTPPTPPKPTDSPLDLPNLGSQTSTAPPSVPPTVPSLSTPPLHDHKNTPTTENKSSSVPPPVQLNENKTSTPKMEMPKIELDTPKMETGTTPPPPLTDPKTPSMEVKTIPQGFTPTTSSPSVPFNGFKNEPPSPPTTQGNSNQMVKIKEQPDLPKSDLIMPAPVRGGFGTSANVPSTGQGQVEVYDITVVQVKAGEDLPMLAKRLYGSEKYAAALEEYLKLYDPKQLNLQTGQSVRVPPLELLHKKFGRLIDGHDVADKPKAHSNLTSGPRGSNSTTQPLVRTSNPPPNQGSSGDPYIRYRVREQDTIWMIAKKTLGNSDRWAEIYNLNRDLLSGSTQLKVGMVLRLPSDAKVDIQP